MEAQNEVLERLQGDIEAWIGLTNEAMHKTDDPNKVTYYQGKLDGYEAVRKWLREQRKKAK